MDTKSTIRHFLTFFLILCANHSLSQNTIGLVVDESDAADGYILIYPDQQGSLFLLNSCGELVHTWEDQNSTPGNGSRLMAEGQIMRTFVDLDGSNPIFTAGGNGEHLEIKNWENEVIWQYTLSTDTTCIHHDAEVLPNGNVLVIAWESKSIEEAALEGRDIAGFGFNSIWPDMVLELHPIGADSADIVWEWHAWDHLIQDFDALANNFGEVSLHPELIDVNYVDEANNNSDWLHINSIDYNPVLDQIMLSSPYFNELWVIDHSTTTMEASGHSGGASGRGGDLLYRWGNPQAYKQGSPLDQKLFFNHAAKWIGQGLDEEDPDIGNIMVFNNRVQPEVSSVDILSPPVDMEGNYTYQPNNAYAPLDITSRYATQVPTDMFTPGQGSGQKLPNGHVLVSPGKQGRVIQLRPDSTISWSYVTPMINGIPIAQGTEVENHIVLFQAEWIAEDDPRIAGRTLEPLGYIELEPDTSFCSIPLGVSTESYLHDDIRVLVQYDQLYIYNSPSAGRYHIYDLSGRMIRSGSLGPAQDVIDLQGVVPGHYILGLADSQPIRFIVSD